MVSPFTSSSASATPASTAAAAVAADVPNLVPKMALGPEITAVIATPIRLENWMYTASPAGNWKVKKPNIIGINQSIIWFVCAERSSIAGIALIFCCPHIDAPTRIVSAKLKGAGAFWTRSTRSIPMNILSSGTLLAAGFHA